MPDAPHSGPMIFISYRRDDSSGHVGRLYDALSAHFGRKRLFFDIDHIAPGQDFVRVLEDSLSRSSVMIVVIGKRWGGSGKVGARRIDDAGDFVRLEVASGLRRAELKIIPALIQGTKMPGAAALPEDLKDLSRRNAIELSDLRWREDIERLIASLERDMASGAPHRSAAELVRKAREITHAPLVNGIALVTHRDGLRLHLSLIVAQSCFLRRLGSPDAGNAARGCQCRVLGQEAVSGVQRLGAGGYRGFYDALDVEVALRRRCWSESPRGVGDADMPRADVSVAVHSDGADAEGAKGAHDSDRDLTAIRYENGVEHQSSSLTSGTRRSRRDRAGPARRATARDPTRCASGMAR